MTKDELRLLYKNKRAELDLDKIDDLSIEVANQALSLDIWSKNNYHIFLPITKQKEVNTEFLISILQGKDKNIIVPKTNFEENALQHILLSDNTKLVVNNYGIPEPENGIEIQEQQIDVVFIPLLVFDKDGNRIGYGKGFYDNFLKNCKPNTIKIGLSLFNLNKDISIKKEPHDVKLNYCITPNEVYKF